MSDVWPGRPFPLGATWDGGGTNFSIFSEHAEGVELCLFDDHDNETRINVTQRRGLNWHCYLPEVGPGQRYGFRVHGRYAPRQGHRFNPAKLLIDPYSKAIDGVVDQSCGANVLPYKPSGSPDADLELDDQDDARAIPKSVVIDDAFFWEGDRPPQIPFADQVIYETHVKGFTMRHPGVREDLRGTYAGLASEEAIAYLIDLGVTAVELLPVHHIADESFLSERSLHNYWGYSTIGYFAPHSEYAATGRDGEQVREFKGMVKALHRAGIEVILDVVYNHTAEGHHLGPMLAFKGADNFSYYRLMPDDHRLYMDFTGTGNSLNPVHPSVLRLIMDSLRYWVTDCHVDGFRFDLASALAREFYDVDRLSAFFDVIHQDPVLSQVKLIAEPWDVGPGGYQVGNFPVLWSEWNGVYRDTMRDYWRGASHSGEFAQRLSGSADLYESDGRDPFASINFITAHDGFTLRDLVSYEHKRNEANKEHNRDGTDDNRTWNCGVEGETERSRDPRAAGAPTAQLHDDAVRLAGNADAARGRRDGTHAGRQQQRLVPGQRGLVVRLARRRGRSADARLHAAADPPAPRAPRVSPRHVPARQGAQGLRAARRVVVSRRWAEDDPPRLAERRARAGDVPQRARDQDSRSPRRGLRGRLVPAAVQRAQRRSRVHVAAPAVRGAMDARALHGGPRCPARERHLRCPDEAERHLALDRDPQAGQMSGPGAELRATYRLQLTADFGFAAARALVPYLRDLGVSHLYLSPSLQSRAGSQHGYDVVDPRRLSDERGGAGEFRALSAAARDAGMGIVLDVVPNHMAVDDANRYWTDPSLRERFFDIDPVTGRHRRFFSIDDLAGLRQGGRVGVRGDPRAGAVAGCRRAWSTRCGSTIPTGSRTPPATSGGCPSGAWRASGWRRSSSSGERLPDWPVAGTVGYEFLNDVCALFVDRGSEPALTALWEQVSGDSRAVRGCRARVQARAGARAVRARRAAAGARPCRRRTTRRDRRFGTRAGVVAGLPHLRRSCARAGQRRRPSRDRVRRHARGAGADPPARARGAERVRDPLSADDTGDHGQGRRGHGVLSLLQAAGFQ